MRQSFRDRMEAGRELADLLAPRLADDDVVVLALPRGGVPVAHEIARRLRAPLDVFVVRKLGLPGFEEFAMGAIASGGIRVLNTEMLATMCPSEALLAEVERRERIELNRRERVYRGTLPPIQAGNRTVILVDDGVATGSTMLAGIRAVRKLGPTRLIVAVPVASESSFNALLKVADEVVTLLVPEKFSSVGQWYVDFSEVTDEEVQSLLEDSSALIPGRISAS